MVLGVGRVLVGVVRFPASDMDGRGRWDVVDDFNDATEPVGEVIDARTAPEGAVVEALTAAAAALVFAPAEGAGLVGTIDALRVVAVDDVREAEADGLETAAAGGVLLDFLRGGALVAGFIAALEETDDLGAVFTTPIPNVPELMIFLTVGVGGALGVFPWEGFTESPGLDFVGDSGFLVFGISVPVTLEPGWIFGDISGHVSGISRSFS